MSDRPVLPLDETRGEGRTDTPRSSGDYSRHVEPAAEWHLLDYVRILHRRRRTALTLFLLVVGAVIVYVFTKTPIYEAKVQILIENENPNVVTFQEVIDQEKATNDYYQTQYRILQSRSLARKTIETLNLWNEPELGGRPGGVAAPSGNPQAGGVREAPAIDETAAQSAAIDRFLSRLTVSAVRNSRLVDVYFRSSAPDLAARVANAFAQAYIGQNLEFKFLSSKEASDWLGQRLSEQRRQVQASEVAVQQYRERNDAVSLEDRQNIVVQKLGDLNAAVTRAKTERIQKEALHDQLQAIQNNPKALDTIPAILGNAFIQSIKSDLSSLQQQRAQLSEKLGDLHPEMVRLESAIQTVEAKLQAEIGKVVQSVRNDYLAAGAQERSLLQALEDQKRDAMELNRKAIQYDALERDAKSNRQIFETLLQRTKETGISGELKTSNIRIVDPAERPRRPISPDIRFDLLMAILVGGIAAVGGAFFVEYLDNRIKTPNEVKQHLGVPCLGLIPMLPPEGGNQLINNGVPPGYGEAFRALRTNVLFSSAEPGNRSIVITSTSPREGKTLVSSNLAISLAQAGMRVLLIDADMRCPRVHELFDVPQEPGLSNVLVGNAKASDAVCQSAIERLWLLPAGLQPPNPAELVGAQRFRELLEGVSQRFDWTIIDSPPLLPVTDASVMSHWASGVVFVVGAGMVSRHAASTAVEQLRSVKARCLGAILNRVDLEGQSYYYSSYYRPDYNRYYRDAS